MNYDPSLSRGCGRIEICRDPISGAIGLTSLIEGVIGGASIAGISAGAIGGAILGVGASVALNYAASALQSRGSNPLSNYSSGGLNDAAIKFNERQGIPSKRIIYGTSQVGGALFFEKVKPPYLYQGFLICADEITQFRKFWVGTQEISFATLNTNATLTPLAVDGQPNYPARLAVSLRSGLPSQTLDGLLHADFTNLDATFRQQGIATVVVRYHYGSDYTEFTKLWGQVQKPNPLFLVDGVAVPDPRVPGTVLDWDPDDDDSVAAAKETWDFNNTASLVQAHYLTQRYGGRVPPSQIDWDKVAKAADFDDDLVACNDGTFIKRYTIDGLIKLNQSPAQVMAGLLSANRGFVLNKPGKVWPSSSPPLTPVVAVTDDLLAGALSYRSDKPKRDLLNEVTPTFVAPDREYQTVDGPTLSRTDLIANDNETLADTLDLPFTLDHRRAQRLTKAYLSNSRLGRQITCRCDVMLLAHAQDELIGNVVRFSSVLFPQLNGTYLVTKWSFTDGFAAIDLSLTQYDAAIETDWIAANDEKPFTIAALNVS